LGVEKREGEGGGISNDLHKAIVRDQGPSAQWTRSGKEKLRRGRLLLVSVNLGRKRGSRSTLRVTARKAAHPIERRSSTLDRGKVGGDVAV